MELKEKIVGTLENHPEGLTITNLTKLTGVSRYRVSLALAELNGAGRIKVRRVGMAKLHYLERGDLRWI